MAYLFSVPYSAQGRTRARESNQPGGAKGPLVHRPRAAFHMAATLFYYLMFLLGVVAAQSAFFFFFFFSPKVPTPATLAGVCNNGASHAGPYCCYTCRYFRCTDNNRNNNKNNNNIIIIININIIVSIPGMLPVLQYATILWIYTGQN